MAVQLANMSRPNSGGQLFQSTLANGDTSALMDLGDHRFEMAWQATGTFGAGGSVQLEVSVDGTNFVIKGSALTAAGLAEATSGARWARFNCTAGDGTTAIVVSLYVISQQG